MGCWSNLSMGRFEFEKIAKENVILMRERVEYNHSLNHGDQGSKKGQGVLILFCSAIFSVMYF